MIKYEIVTPREHEEPIEILYGLRTTIFGKVLIGVTIQSICYLSFYDVETSAIAILKKEWPCISSLLERGWASNRKNCSRYF